MGGPGAPRGGRAGCDARADVRPGCGACRSRSPENRAGVCAGRRAGARCVFLRRGEDGRGDGRDPRRRDAACGRAHPRSAQQHCRAGDRGLARCWRGLWHQRSGATVTRAAARPEIVAAARELRRGLYAAVFLVSSMPRREVEPGWLTVARALAMPAGQDSREDAAQRFAGEVYFVSRLLGRGGRCGSLADDQQAGRRIAQAMESDHAARG